MYEALDVDKEEVSACVCETGIGQYDPAVVSSMLRECETVRSSIDHSTFFPSHISPSQSMKGFKRLTRKEDHIVKIVKEESGDRTPSFLTKSFFSKFLLPKGYASKRTTI
ncbi:hypothetical protein ACOME3_002315 [Neoechinorhynchus agilis]